MIRVMRLHDERAIMYPKLEGLPDLLRHSNTDRDLNPLFCLAPSFLSPTDFKDHIGREISFHLQSLHGP